MEKEIISNNQETSGGWYCRGCGAQLYSEDLYCERCLEFLRRENPCRFCSISSCGFCNLRLLKDC